MKHVDRLDHAHRLRQKKSETHENERKVNMIEEWRENKDIGNINIKTNGKTWKSKDQVTT